MATDSNHLPTCLMTMLKEGALNCCFNCGLHGEYNIKTIAREKR